MQLTPRYDGPTLLHIDDAVGNPAVPMLRQRRRLVEHLRTLDDEQWRMPSRCDGWTVQDVVSHLVSVDQFWGMSIGAGLAGTPTRFLATFDPVATPAQLVDRTQGLPAAEVLDSFAAGVDALAATVADLDVTSLSTIAEAPPGHVAMRAVLLHALWDAWIHERDILVPLGIAQALEADEVTCCLAYAAALGPALTASMGSTREGSLVVQATDPDVVVVVDAGSTVTVRLGGTPGEPHLRGPAVDLVDALSFRAPFPTPIDDEHQWLVGGLAVAFDRA